MPDAPYTLYFDYLTSAIIPHVMLDEIGADYRLVHVDTTVDAHEKDAFRKLNPNMLLPTLALPDGRCIGENGAILVMLGDLHPDAGLVPRLDAPDRPTFLHWLFALATTGHTTLRRHAYPSEYTTRPDAEDATRAAAWAQATRFFDVLEDAISGDPWFLARGFGPLDIYLALLVGILTEDQRAEAYAGRPKLARLGRAAHARDSVARLWEFYRMAPVTP